MYHWFSAELENVTLEDVFVFATGCTEIPGFEPQPNLCFNPDGSFPTASTVALL